MWGNLYDKHIIRRKYDRQLHEKRGCTIDREVAPGVFKLRAMTNAEIAVHPYRNDFDLGRFTNESKNLMACKSSNDKGDHYFAESKKYGYLGMFTCWRKIKECLFISNDDVYKISLWFKKENMNYLTQAYDAGRKKIKQFTITLPENLLNKEK